MNQVVDSAAARRFQRRAEATFASADFLEQAVMSQLHQRLAGMRAEKRDIAVLTAHPAARWQALATAYPSAVIHSEAVCSGEVGLSTLADHSQDVVLVNLAWSVSDLTQAFSAAKRVLRDQGLILFSLLGPASLQSLHQAFSDDNYTHAYHFFDMHDVGDLLLSLRFSDPVMESYWPEVRYQRVQSLMRDLRAMGAQYAEQGRRRGLTGKGLWRRAMAELTAQMTDGYLALPMEVSIGHAWVGASTTAPVAVTDSSPGEVRVPVTELQRRQDGEDGKNRG